MFQLNGQTINIDAEQVINDIRYPNLRDPQLRKELGILELSDPEQYDQRFYWGINNPKQLEDKTETPEGSDTPVTSKGLKTQWVAQVKDTAGKMLAQSDWMIVRQVERAVAIPQKTVDYRAAVIAETDRLEAAIVACKTVEELIEIVNAQNWPQTDRI